VTVPADRNEYSGNELNGILKETARKNEYIAAEHTEIKSLDNSKPIHYNLPGY
jgi:hypothetical protein